MTIPRHGPHKQRAQTPHNTDTTPTIILSVGKQQGHPPPIGQGITLNTTSSALIPYNDKPVNAPIQYSYDITLGVTHHAAQTSCLLATVSTMGKRLHPMGLSMQYHDTRGAGMTQQEIRTDLFHNSRIRTMEGVALGTQLAYDPGWKSYVDFMNNTMQAHPLFYTRHDQWNTEFESVGIPYAVSIMTSFVEYLVAKEQQNGQRICQYLTAVKSRLTTCSVDISFFDNPIIRAARAAMERLHRATHGDKIKRFPATTEFICIFVQNVRQKQTMEGYAFAVAAMMAFTTLLRVGEYLGDGDHCIRAKHVKFEVKSPQQNRSLYILPEDIHNYKLQDVIAVDFLIPSSKCDDEGLPFHIDRTPVSHECAFDTVEAMFDWACLSKPAGTNPFLSWKQEGKTTWPSYNNFNLEIKKVALSLGLPTDQASSHVFRIGGACAMFYAGMTDAQIMIYGRWKSLAFLKYLRKSRETTKAALAVILNPNVLTTEEVRQFAFLHTGG